MKQFITFGCPDGLSVSFRPENIVGVTEQGADNGRPTCRLLVFGFAVGSSWSVLGEREAILARIENFYDSEEATADA